MRTLDASSIRRGAVAELFARPFPTTASVLVPFAVFASLVPGYLVVGTYAPGRTLHMPELALDRAWPVQPVWTLVYGSLYFAVFLPMVVLRQEEHIRRTLWALVMIWIVGSAGWLIYPTMLPRPSPATLGAGFCDWALQIAYTWDAPYNCFPSLHVAQAVLAAFTCNLVSRGIGLAAGVWASLIAISTLFTKQHYVADVIAGALLGGLAYFVFLRGYSRTSVTRLDKSVGPVVVVGFLGVHTFAILGFWVAYQMR